MRERQRETETESVRETETEKERQRSRGWGERERERGTERERDIDTDKERWLSEHSVLPACHLLIESTDLPGHQPRIHSECPTQEHGAVRNGTVNTDTALCLSVVMGTRGGGRVGP